MSELIVYVGNPNIVRVDGLVAENAQTTFINDATVTCTVTDADGDEITGETWPLTMSYVTSSDGRYQAELVYTLPFVADTEYFITIEATSDARYAKWTIPVRPKRRDVA